MWTGPLLVVDSSDQNEGKKNGIIWAILVLFLQYCKMYCIVFSSPAITPQVRPLEVRSSRPLRWWLSSEETSDRECFLRYYCAVTLFRFPFSTYFLINYHPKNEVSLIVQEIPWGQISLSDHFSFCGSLAPYKDGMMIFTPVSNIVSQCCKQGSTSAPRIQGSKVRMKKLWQLSFLRTSYSSDVKCSLKGIENQRAVVVVDGWAMDSEWGMNGGIVSSSSSVCYLYNPLIPVTAYSIWYGFNLGFPMVPNKTEFLDKSSINIDILPAFFGPQGSHRYNLWHLFS